MTTTLYHPRYASYDFGPGHSFSPTRQTMLLDLLEASGHAPDLIEPPPAAREDLLRVHSDSFVEQVEAASGEGRADGTARRFGIGTSDTPAFESMDLATRHLVGGTLEAARRIADGRATRALQLGGGLHHAHADRASGFCVYNDLAVALRHLTSEDLRVAYIDIDVHHGDGVQQVFYDDPDVLTISLHESGRYLFPGTGFPDEIGTGAGEGYALNVPLAPGTTGEGYLDVFERVVPRALAGFSPDVLVLQCGADAHRSDPLAHLALSTRTYEEIFRRLLALADEFAGGRLLATHGGGYNLDATVRVWALLYFVLAGRPLPEPLPASWRERWHERTGTELSPMLHDTEVTETSQGEDVQAHNEQQVEALLDAIDGW